MSATTFYDPDTDEFLFLVDGTPDILTHSLWRAGVMNIYRPGDWTDMFVTVDPHGVRTDWPFTDAEIPTHRLPLRPWISYDEVTYGLANDEIVAFDTWRRDPDAVDYAPAPHWEEYLRPVLVRPPPPELTLPPLPSAPPAEPPQRSVPVINTALPPHIQRLVIDAAIATGATCPITMEPITADTAVITPCGHVFGTELTPRVSLCPVCRSTL
jgi:hypothetical protein